MIDFIFLSYWLSFVKFIFFFTAEHFHFKFITFFKNLSDSREMSLLKEQKLFQFSFKVIAVNV